jgi:hypothetical protein
MKDIPELKVRLITKENTNEQKDMVNHPSHYTFSKYEVVEVLDEWFPNDPLIWQVVKYLARAKYKNNELEDLKKAQFYLTRKINKLNEVSKNI